MILVYMNKVLLFTRNKKREEGEGSRPRAQSRVREEMNLIMVDTRGKRFYPLLAESPLDWTISFLSLIRQLSNIRQAYC